MAYKIKPIDSYGKFDADRWMPWIEPVLRSAVEMNVGIEINTSGVRQSPCEPYPGLETLKLYHELGGSILTIGSDAHRSSHLGVGLEKGLQLAKTAGFEGVCRFENRQPSLLPF